MGNNDMHKTEVTSLSFFLNCAQLYVNATPKFLAAFQVKKLSIHKWQIFTDICGSITLKIPITIWAMGPIVESKLQENNSLGQLLKNCA